MCSVDFVEDYVQLEWEQSYLTAYTMPVVLAEGVEHRHEEKDYKEVMYRLEGQLLCNAKVVEAEAVSLHFERGTLLTISLRDADYVVAEALLYGETNGSLWVV